MKWSDALAQAKEKIKAVDDYVDESGLIGDAKEQIDKHAPEVLKTPLTEALELIDRMLNALADDDPDNV